MTKKRTSGAAAAALFGLALCLAATGNGWADLAPGDVINKDNYDKAQGLLPDAVLNWVKKGDATLEVGQLNFNPAEFMPPSCVEGLAINDGKYDVDADSVLVDKQTGKSPDFVVGMPFPKIDPADPKAGPKIMYNKAYYTYAVGNLVVPFQALWVGRTTKVERELNCDYLVYVMDGWTGAKGQNNPDNIEMYSVIRILAPFDIAGTNVLTWRYRDKRPDSTFTYVPAIRRVRRMSPANRSDAFVGSDFTVDDAWGYAGKVNAFEWKVLKKTDQLVPFWTKDPQALTQNSKGEYETSKSVKISNWGFQRENWTGAPWFPMDLVWVKRPTYILEIKAKDPYYNYGVQYLWVDAEFFQPTFKVIHDRSGAYWKVEWQPQAAWESPDKKIRLIGNGCMVATDDRSDHTTVLTLASPTNISRYFCVMDVNDYSLSGFQKLCK